MDYVTLGRTGLQVSRICLGGNSWGAAGRRAWAPFDAAASRTFFRHALDKGINYFDTADSYNTGESETVMGTELVGAVPRDELVITTKVGNPMADRPNAAGTSRKHVLASIDASLRRLRTDYVDVYMLHRLDTRTPAEETLSALADILRAGKARYIAASTMRPTQFARLQVMAKAMGLPGFAAMQSLYNLVDREDEADLIPFCNEEGVALTPYSPLARGTLTRGTQAGAPNAPAEGASERARLDKAADRYATPRAVGIAAAVADVAAGLGVPPAQVALAWLLHQKGVVAPILGVTRTAQIDDAVAACGVTLGAEALAKLG